MATRTSPSATVRNSLVRLYSTGGRPMQLPVAAGAAGGAIGLPCAPVPRPARFETEIAATNVVVVDRWRYRLREG